jgi:hypothetical protein
MTLMAGTLAAILLGLIFGWRTWTAVALGLIWYIALAVQTAYLAHPDRTGFLRVKALPAVQGSGFGQYWIAQPVILAGSALLMRSASRARVQWRESRLAGRSPSQRSPSKAVPE